MRISIPPLRPEQISGYPENDHASEKSRETLTLDFRSHAAA
ncbi:hypothetical protein NSERUTF1_6528 [Nocardia seriolae]|nr:hypothetical protein NSERUTF1_6528 [Nocardia seriolae]